MLTPLCLNAHLFYLMYWSKFSLEIAECAARLGVYTDDIILHSASITFVIWCWEMLECLIVPETVFKHRTQLTVDKTFGVYCIMEISF